jgi:tRNA (guanine-N7-)-methyltransferase
MEQSTHQPKPAVTTEGIILKVENILSRLNPATVFQKEQPIEVELGSGDGSFIAAYARAHPESNFFAVERLLGRLRKIEKKAKRFGLSNICGLRIEAGYFLDFLLPHPSAQAIHVYFPDPWPKRKHRPNRLINEEFTVRCTRVLRPGGVVYLRTDDLDYFQQMKRVFDANKNFQEVPTPESISSFITDFERNFHTQGVPTLAAAYRLVAASIDREEA